MYWKYARWHSDIDLHYTENDSIYETVIIPGNMLRVWCSPFTVIIRKMCTLLILRTSKLRSLALNWYWTFYFEMASFHYTTCTVVFKRAICKSSKRHAVKTYILLNNFPEISVVGCWFDIIYIVDSITMLAYYK